MDTSTWENPYRNPNPYIPASLSELQDYMTLLIGHAPKFIDKFGDFPDRNLESVFAVLNEAFGVVRKKLGEERYAAAVDLATRMKALFAADPDETNGKTGEGIKLVWELEDLLRDARRRRVKAKLPDEDGEVTGD